MDCEFVLEGIVEGIVEGLLEDSMYISSIIRIITGTGIHSCVTSFTLSSLTVALIGLPIVA